MIFVTVGTQGSFDRLVHAVDRWAIDRGRNDLFAQVGPTEAPPDRIEWVRHLSPAEFRQRVEEAEVVVSHAGMGTILTALELCKPVLVFPRLARLREQRNDHQTATARQLAAAGKVTAAFDENELRQRLDNLQELLPAAASPLPASALLLDRLRRFFSGEEEA